MQNFPKNYSGLTCAELPASAYPYIMAQSFQQIKGQILYIALNESLALAAANFFAKFLPDKQQVYFPAWDVLPYDRISPNQQIVSNRLAALQKLQEEQVDIVITTLNAIALKVIPPQIFSKFFLELTAGQNYSQDQLKSFLVNNSYLRVERVTEAGEFSVRGSLLDIFPVGSNEPYRLDFFADELSSIKNFDPLTQLTSIKCSKLMILPAHEVILNEEFIANFRKNYRAQFTVNYQEDLLYEAVSEGRYYHGMEHWLPLFYDDQLVDFTNYLTEPVIFTDELFIDAFKEREKTIQDYYQARNLVSDKEHGGQNYQAIKPEQLYLSVADYESLQQKYPQIFLTSLATKSQFSISSAAKLLPDFIAQAKAQKQPLFALLKDFLLERQNLNPQIKIYLTAHHDLVKERLSKLCAEYDFHELKNLTLINSDLEKGFYDQQHIYISSQDLFGSKVVRNNRKKKSAKLILEIEALQVGELVVHQEHGIGRFIGLQLLAVSGKEHEFVALEYAGQDKLYLPVENLELLKRYGSENGLAALDRLGSANFQERRARLKKKIRDIAAGLIKIASERELTKAQIFTAPTDLYEEFAAKFPYDETEDQLQAMLEVATDLNSGQVMDRLICGDVGFGKTEIAMRAAFQILAAPHKQAKPQIAVIVPTTLLSRQHYSNFCERFADYGFNIKQLSRMVTNTEQRKTKEQLKNGEVDIVIGTHALLSKKLEFNNLALAIIDEEQHFGVSQKERIKSFKNNVHLLTLSATPIPRTMQMSLNGIRDMSLLATPPVDRMAIRSYVMPFDNLVIREAILREYYRGGRIFYVCPRIKDLERESIKISKLAPEIKFAVAHGGLPAEQLDQIMNDFCDGKYDLLLSTSIIESGIDIKQANTIIIHHADKFGLAQLYQMRGRVGRSKIRAYAYFTFEPKKILEGNAKKRLEVMQTLDGLGAGFNLAAHDLDIRGAGNLLGEEQSGHIKEVGVELYQAMLRETIAELRAAQDKALKEQQQEEFSPQVKVGVTVLIPEQYITDISSRMEFYRRIANLQNKEEIDDLLFELADRFGKIPEQVNNLIMLVHLKNLCKEAYVAKLDMGPKATILTFHNDEFPYPDNLLNYVLKNCHLLKLRPDQKLLINIAGEAQDNIGKIENILQEIANLSC